jgi:hypothetical protein
MQWQDVGSKLELLGPRLHNSLIYIIYLVSMGLENSFTVAAPGLGRKSWSSAQRQTANLIWCHAVHEFLSKNPGMISPDGVDEDTVLNRSSTFELLIGEEQ